MKKNLILFSILYLFFWDCIAVDFLRHISSPMLQTNLKLLMNAENKDTCKSLLSQECECFYKLIQNVDFGTDFTKNKKDSFFNNFERYHISRIDEFVKNNLNDIRLINKILFPEWIKLSSQDQEICHKTMSDVQLLSYTGPAFARTTENKFSEQCHDDTAMLANLLDSKSILTEQTKLAQRTCNVYFDKMQSSSDSLKKTKNMMRYNPFLLQTSLISSSYFGWLLYNSSVALATCTNPFTIGILSLAGISSYLLCNNYKKYFMKKAAFNIACKNEELSNSSYNSLKERNSFLDKDITEKQQLLLNNQQKLTKLKTPLFKLLKDLNQASDFSLQPHFIKFQTQAASIHFLYKISQIKITNTAEEDLSLFADAIRSYSCIN